MHERLNLLLEETRPALIVSKYSYRFLLPEIGLSFMILSMSGL